MLVTDTDMHEALQQGDNAKALRLADWLDRRDAADRRMGSSPPGASPLGAALWYAQRGLKVFPIQPRRKIPYAGTRGLHDATSEPEQIQALFADRAGANLAIATGHLVDVIDFDGPGAHAAWGQQWVTWDAAGVVVLGSVSTPRHGGLHIYHPATGAGNRAGMLPGVDYRGLGGYVVVPPSVTAQGSYHWLRRLPEVLG